MPQRLPGTTLDVPLRLSPSGTLASVDVYITSQCSRRCAYCFMPPDFFASGMRMSLDHFSGVVSWSRQHGVKEITLLGGEPSLHPSFATMVKLASNRGMDVRVVTNGARRFRRLLKDGSVEPHRLSRVAVSLDTLDEAVQDKLRGPGALQDAMATIALLRDHGVLFDINVTAVRPVLCGVEALIDFADRACCRRVNVHWPSTMGIGNGLDVDQIPDRYEWEELVRRVESRVERKPDFFVEIERGFLAAGELAHRMCLDRLLQLAGPPGRPCLSMRPACRSGGNGIAVHDRRLSFVLTRPGYGEELLRTSMPHICDGCPVMRADGRRAWHLRQGQLQASRVSARGLVIFDAFNTLVTARPGSRRTFPRRASEGWPRCHGFSARRVAACQRRIGSLSLVCIRETYLEWARRTLSRLGQERSTRDADLARCVVPALGAAPGSDGADARGR